MDTTEPQDAGRWLRPAEAASLFGVDPQTLRNWVKAGKIRAQRTVGGQRRYHEADVRVLLTELGAVA